MDFFNFEKHNDVFCFKKLNNDYQPSLKIYKNNYETSLNSFITEYDENTELRFLESQLYFCITEINVQKSIIQSLEQRCEGTFNYIRNRLNERHFVYLKTQKCQFGNIPIIPKIEQKIDDLGELRAPTIIAFTNEDEDDEVLDTYATTQNFIKFISNRITSLYLINDFLKNRKQQIEKPQQNNFSTNKIFVETKSLENFKNYLRLHILEPYVDYSYLFQRMLIENIIKKTKHLEFVNWLFKNKFITESIKDKFIEKGSFRTLNKSFSTQRENNFNNVFNL